MWVASRYRRSWALFGTAGRVLLTKGTWLLPRCPSRCNPARQRTAQDGGRCAGPGQLVSDFVSINRSATRLDCGILTRLPGIGSLHSSDPPSLRCQHLPWASWGGQRSMEPRISISLGNAAEISALGPYCSFFCFLKQVILSDFPKQCWTGLFCVLCPPWTLTVTVVLQKGGWIHHDRGQPPTYTRSSKTKKPLAWLLPGRT